MNLSEPFIRRPVATSLIMAALALLGIVAFPFLPVAPLPQVDFPTISITGTSPAPAPRRWRPSVAAPLERQFGQIPGVTQLTLTSALGATNVVVQFDLNRNIDAAAQDVQAAITAASKFLPSDDLSADLPQGQSGGRADHDAVGAFRYVAAHHGPRLPRQFLHPVAVAGAGRGAGLDLWRPEAFDPRPGRPDEACSGSA